MIKVKTYTNGEGTHISTIDSYLAWTEMTKEMRLNDAKMLYDEDGACAYCHGAMELNTKEFGKMRCICQLAPKELQMEKTIAQYSDMHPPKSMTDLKIWGDTNSRRDISDLKKLISKWKQNPDKWITLMGLPGCGKTHVLQSLDTYFHPWSLYVTTMNLESRFYQALDDNSLPELIDAIKRVPILLLDDLGSDYGKDYVKANIRKIIDFRYSLWQEFPTVVATNYWAREIKDKYDPRIGDRLLDHHIAHVIELEVESWRVNHD